MKYDIFISYSRKDIEFARKVCAVLDSYKQYYDFEYFFDQSEITSRDEYLKRISSAILESRVVLFLASKNSYDSEFCAKELLFADKKGRHIHQYLLDEAEMPSDIEMLLGTHQYRELKNTPIESVVKEVLYNSLSCEILTLDELNENNKLERQKQRSIQQQEIREKISELENRCFEIKAEILSYEQKVAELEREKSSVERQIEDLRCKLTSDEKRDDEQQSTKLRDFIERLKIAMKRPAVWLSAVAVVVIAVLMTVLGKNSDDERYYSVGDFYDDGTKQGVVFEVSEDGKHGKIVSLDETKKMWCIWNPYEKEIFVGASGSDGQKNTDMIMARTDSANFPAFQWCREKGQWWYLPSKEELLLLYEVKDKVNRTLQKESMQVLDSWYWSSTEYNSIFAWYVYMLDGSTDHRGKTYNVINVRAVATF